MNYVEINEAGVAFAWISTPDTLQHPRMVDVGDGDGAAYLGKQWTGSHWLELPALSAPRRLTSLAFRRRFTVAEQVAIEVASLDDPAGTPEVRQQQAALRVYLRNIDIAAFVDLDDPDVIAGVAQLDGLGLLGSGRADAILNAAIQDGERMQ